MYRLLASELVYDLKRGTGGPLLKEGAAVMCSKSENGCQGSRAGGRRPLNDPDIAG